jgi:hypothetical protein
MTSFVRGCTLLSVEFAAKHLPAATIMVAAAHMPAEWRHVHMQHVTMRIQCSCCERKWFVTLWSAVPDICR